MITEYDHYSVTTLYFQYFKPQLLCLISSSNFEVTLQISRERRDSYKRRDISHVRMSLAPSRRSVGWAAAWKKAHEKLAGRSPVQEGERTPNLSLYFAPPFFFFFFFFFSRCIPTIWTPERGLNEQNHLGFLREWGAGSWSISRESEG